MKKLIYVLIPLSILGLAWTILYDGNEYDKEIVERVEASNSIYSIPLKSIEGEEFTLEKYKGKKILIVNVASMCGYTPQYEDLQTLYENYKDKLVIVGAPCNQFGGQEPGSSSEIQSFCSKNYGVTFPLTEKLEVKGDGQHPLYAWLTNKEENGVQSSKVKWNFQKYLIDEEGNFVAVFSSGTGPLDSSITEKI